MPKYQPFMPVQLKDRTWPDQEIKQAPMWCSVDLRDGNQALENPMSVEAKVAMFQSLCEIGFKEIEVGFPSASQIDYDFLRILIDENRIPDDVTVQVLCQCRQELIDRTIEGLKGAKRAVFHLYNSTNPAQRKITFGLSKDEIKDIAVKGIQMLKKAMTRIPETEIVLEYSPESFSNTELEYAVEVCDAVINEWQPSADNRVIINLPSTVESTTPNLFADQIEWMCRKISQRENVIISLHPHNDRGTGTAAAELGLLAGADRIEGTLFGNGERTGNLDVINVALNMYSQGVEPGLDVFNIPKMVREYEEYTGMMVPPRHPYAGKLVYTAFSGSHQDAIRKGMDYQSKQKTDDLWEVPYLPIDPKDIGRSYQAIIRYNSQSGKGGAAYILQNAYHIEMPKAMHPEFGKILNRVADTKGEELTSEEIYNAFKDEYLCCNAPLVLKDFFFHHPPKGVEEGTGEGIVEINGKEQTFKAKGQGPIDAFMNGLKKVGINGFDIVQFHEHSIGQGKATEAAAYTCIRLPGDDQFWGCGIDKDITRAGIASVISAYNRSCQEQ